MRAGKGTEWHHVARRIADMPLIQIFRLHAVGGIALHKNLFHPPFINKVVHIGGTPSSAQGSVDPVSYTHLDVYKRQQ